MKDGGPAFPCVQSAGMTLRDYFAAAALPAVIAAYDRSNGPAGTIGTDHILRNCSVIAFKFADAMLAEREKRPWTRADAERLAKRLTENQR